MNADSIDTLELGQRIKEDGVNVWPVETSDGLPLYIEFQTANLKPKDGKLFVQNRPRSRELDKTLIALENKLLSLLKPKVKTKDDDALLAVIKMHLVNENANVIYKFHISNMEVVVRSIGGFYNDHAQAFTLENLNHVRDCIENFRETRATLLS